MGLAYYRLKPAELQALRPLIALHEAEIIGPRARGYWFDHPDDYDYATARDVARRLDDAGKRAGLAHLELSEVQAHALGLLEVELPPDGEPLPPAPFLSSAGPDGVHMQLTAIRAALGDDPDHAAAHLSVNGRDRRFAGYLKKQVRHLREALPVIWRFYAQAAEAGEAILVVDLRARDLYEPDAAEQAEAEQ